MRQGAVLSGEPWNGYWCITTWQLSLYVAVHIRYKTYQWVACSVSYPLKSWSSIFWPKNSKNSTNAGLSSLFPNSSSSTVYNDKDITFQLRNKFRSLQKGSYSIHYNWSHMKNVRMLTLALTLTFVTFHTNRNFVWTNCYDSTLNIYIHDICIYVLGCSWLYKSTYTESQYNSQEHHSLFESVLTVTWKCNDTAFVRQNKA